MLESLADPNQVNIKDLTLERPVFDHEHYIYNPPFYEECWDQMQKLLNKVQPPGDFNDVEYFSLSTGMALLNPAKRGSIEPLGTSMTNMVSGLKRSNYQKVLFSIAVVKGALLYPGLTRERLKLEGIETDVLEGVIHDVYRPFQSDDLAWAYIAAKRLFPDRIGLREDKVDYLISKINEERNKEDWHRFVRLAASLKVAFPERFAELQITEQDWEGMVDKLRERTSNWDNYSLVAGHFAEIAGNMKIIGSSSIDDILTIPVFDDGRVPLPIRRAF